MEKKIAKAVDLTDAERDSLCPVRRSEHGYDCTRCDFYRTLFHGSHMPYCRLFGGGDGYGADEALLIDLTTGKPEN
jgi:hypothetical protein